LDVPGQARPRLEQALRPVWQGGHVLALDDGPAYVTGGIPLKHDAAERLMVIEFGDQPFSSTGDPGA